MQRVVGCGLLTLSYDDGPGRTLTPQILHLLKSHGVRATFFMLGCRVQASLDVARRVVEDGHEVGSHSYHHLNAWHVDRTAACDDVGKGHELVSSMVHETSLFRPPYGKATTSTLASCRQLGIRPVWWTVDCGDTADQLPSVDAVVDEVSRRGGAVVLMHDFDRQEPDADRRHAHVLDCTRALLELADRRGWRVGTVGSLLLDLTS